MTIRDAVQAKQDIITKMGVELGECFNALWQHTARLHVNWCEYVELFGTKQSRVDLINRAAPALFGIMQNVLWDDIILKIARLTDSVHTGKKQNLTICKLLDLIPEGQLLSLTRKNIDLVLVETKFCKSHRNLRIAHSDFELATKPQAISLEGVSRENINRSLDAITETLNAINRHYCDAETNFKSPYRGDGAKQLVGMITLALNVKDEMVSQGKIADLIRLEREK
ncbi:hypothetical protein [Ferrovibrio sp.]|uniref:AbiU2 domain-containing protein n=1 Tax=Ferrovibrio sp. TaxID=1917215 RepID=UPI0035B4B593